MKAISLRTRMAACACATLASLWWSSAFAAQTPPTQPGTPTTGISLTSQPINKQALWQALEKTPFIREGADNRHAKATIYAFFDPNCIFCHLGWKLSQPYLKVGLQVRWIPIAFISTDSTTKVAWLLTSSDPSAALNKGESGWKKGATDGGGDFSDVKATPAIKAEIKANETLFRKLGLDGTPGFVYQDAAGAIHTMAGVTNQHIITAMTGLPFIPTTDPDLAKIPE